MRGNASGLEVRYSTAVQMFLDYGDLGSAGSQDGLRLQSGLPFDVCTLEGKNANEGLAIVAIAGAVEELAARPGGPLVRMHSACVFSRIGTHPALLAEFSGISNLGELRGFGQRPSPDCDCEAQRVAAQALIAQAGGIFFDLDQECRGNGLEIKQRVYSLQRDGHDTVTACEALGVPVDGRGYGHCARYLAACGIEQVRLLSNNPRKREALESGDIRVERVPLRVGETDANRGYLEVKRKKLGHDL